MIQVFQAGGNGTGADLMGRGWVGADDEVEENQVQEINGLVTMFNRVVLMPL